MALLAEQWSSCIVLWLSSYVCQPEFILIRIWIGDFFKHLLKRRFAPSAHQSLCISFLFEATWFVYNKMLGISDGVSHILVWSRPAVLFFTYILWHTKSLEAFRVFLHKMHLPENCITVRGKKKSQFLHYWYSGFICRKPYQHLLISVRLVTYFAIIELKQASPKCVRVWQLYWGRG